MARPRLEDARDAARRAGTFTASELAAQMGVSRTCGVKWLGKLEEAGMVLDTGERRKHGGPGRPAPVYAFNKPEAQHVNRPRQTPVEIEVARSAKVRSIRRGGSAPSGRRAKLTSDPETQRLIAAGRAQGWRFEKTGGHIWAIPPKGGERVRLASSPSDWRSVLNARADLRRQGLAA